MSQPKKDKRPINYQLGINLVFGLIIVFLTFQLFKDNQKIVYINTPKLLMEYKGTQDIQNDLKIKLDDFNTKLDTLKMEINLISSDLNKNNLKISKRELKEKLELIKFKDNQLKSFQQDMNLKLQNEENKLRDVTLKNMNSIIMEYGKSRNYKYIIGGNSNGILLYAEDGLDITEEIIQILNSRYKNISNVK